MIRRPTGKPITHGTTESRRETEVELSGEEMDGREYH